MTADTLALVGAAGGVGTTRLAVECGAMLARAGRSVAVLDAAFATQGLATCLAGTLDPDLTAVVADDAELDGALRTLPLEVPGSLALAPAAAPFQRLARAKTAGAAERFEEAIAAAALGHDVVLVDTPPLAANQAVAAAHGVDRVAVVVPDAARGGDALAQTRARLADLDLACDAVVATPARAPGAIVDPVARMPDLAPVGLGEAPTAHGREDDRAMEMRDCVEALLETELGLEFEEPGRLRGLIERGG